MNILDLTILVFIIMEITNVIILYFFPDSKFGNGVSVFNFFHESKESPSQYLFVSYMVNWVAGVKLIFIVLLAAILFVGNEATKIVSVIAMILSIATYFFRLHPIIKKIDETGHLSPKGYSKTLFMMIVSFIFMFTFALIFYLI